MLKFLMLLLTVCFLSLFTACKIVRVSSSDKELILKEGQKLKIVMPSYPSVGVASFISSDNEQVLKLIHEKFKYRNPLKLRMSGGDEGKTIYILKAMGKGSTSLHILEKFRSKITGKQLVKVFVK